MNPCIPQQKKELHQACNKINYGSERAPYNQLLKSAVHGHYSSFSAMFHLLHSDTNEERYKKCLCNHYGKHGLNSHHNSHREAIPCYHELTPCIVSEQNWDTKEDKGKSVMHLLYVLQLEKKHISG